MIRADQFTTRAREELVGDDTTKELRVVRESGTHITPTYCLCLDLGWCEKIIACGMYKSDAIGIAYALGEVLDCPRIVLP